MVNNENGRQQKIFFTVVVLTILFLVVYILRIPLNTETIETAEKPARVQPAGAFAIKAEDMRMARKSVKVHGIYVSGPVAGSKERMNELISLTEKTPVNAMVIDVKNDSGEITYKMDYPDAIRIGSSKNYIQDINALVRRLKEKNIYLIARIVAFKDPILAKQMPQFSLRNKDGTVFHDRQGLAWVNPYKRGVWNYIINVAVQAAKVGFDEIQFDYIRFSTDSGMKNVSFGGLERKISRQEIILEFTKYACDILKKRGVCVSADVYGGIISSSTDARIVGQDYRKMAKYLDYVSPMMYPSQYSEGSYGIQRPDNFPYDLVYEAMMDSNQKLSNKKDNGIHADVRPWLQGFTASWVDKNIPYTSNEMKAQIHAVYASGNDQWIIWNAANRYSDLGLDNLPEEK